MKGAILLFLAILVNFTVASQDSTSVRYGADFTYKTTIRNGVVYTNAYCNNSFFLKQMELCNFCFIENGRSFWVGSITDTINRLFPLIVDQLIEKDITFYVVLKPNIQGAIVDAYLGWGYSKKLELFSESELMLIHRSLLKLSAKIASIDKYGNTQLCQTLTISIFSKDWKR